MQQAKTKYFKDRSVFYTTFPIRRQAKRGKWNFKLAPVYFIAILDYEYDEDALKRELLRKVSLKDQNNEVFSETLNFIFVQMPLFNKKEHELTTRFDKWLFFLKNLETFEKIPQILNEPIFRKGFEIAKIAKMNLPELSRYERSRLALWEEQAVIDYAKEEGMETGLEISIKVISFLNQGHSIKETAKLAGAPIDFVKKIAAELKIKS
jgi:predicted transposase/invertase (TIGR01784 family)